MQMPLSLIHATQLAVHRRRARERYDGMLDTLMSSGVEWGTAIEGQVPPSNSTYRTVDKPARAHLQQLYQQSLDAPPPTRAEREETHRTLLSSIFAD
ncbi:hypothetical protein [Deinococcus aquiradiocola]|uniref:Uncharacterized protein n=1 Tax=Deinococcus aquiradiocola TaxID=393059 RepID=A0A917P7F2_9DEIO|nr:hypothetical protein [Deinococcus aquiradiocola]GGJ65365.1 hypothetical protein GCM10008939_06610 [Deinococcus aquiradiocola]